VADGLGVDLEPDMPPPRRPGAPPGETEIADFAAGEAVASAEETESMSMTIVWRCLKCNTHFPAGEPIPDACTSCGAPRTEFELVEED
jgi:rubrerythrin